MSMLSDLVQAKVSKTRAITAENPTGEKGNGGKATSGTGALASRELGVGWKVSPSIDLEPNSEVTIADIKGEGAIKHIWMTCFPSFWRDVIIEMYWDNADTPAVQVPYGDFFCNGWKERVNINSLPIAVNPAGGMNSYWEMPFKSSAKIVIRNQGSEKFPLYFQVDYALEEVPEDCLYFHAFWSKSNPLPYKSVHTLLPTLDGRGQYVGTYLAYQSNNTGWWGEGEMKFYLDGDDAFPTICGTGTEDYFGGAWDFEQPQGNYCPYSTAFLGLPQVIKPDGMYQSQQRFGMYRWHILDPIRFDQDIRVTIQALGWRSGGRYLPLQDDISSTSYFYLDQPDGKQLKPNLDPDNLEII